MDIGYRAAILIGVTGRPEITSRARDSVKAGVRWVLNSIRRHYPNTPILLVSPLLSNTDELLAEVACGEFAAGLIVLYFPPLPAQMQVPLGKDYTDSVWRKVGIAIGGLGGVTGGSNLQDLQAARLSAFAARHCQILLGIQDGTASPSSTEAVQVVRYRAEGQFTSLDFERGLEPEGKWVAKNGPLDCQPVATETFEKHPEEMLLRVDSYNADIVRAEGELQEEIEKSKGELIDKVAQAKLSNDSRNLLESHARADTLSLHFQGKMRWSLLILCVLAGLAALFFSAYAHDLLGTEHEKLSLSLYLGLLGLAAVVFLLIRQRDYQNKYIDYRAVAEGLRVQLFWRLAGLRQHVSAHYLRRQRGELDWIRSTIDAYTIGVKPREPVDLNIVYNRWVKDQERYFTDKAPKRERLAFIATTWSGVGLLFSLGLALFALFNPPPRWFEFGLGAIAVIAGIACLWHVLTRHWERVEKFCFQRTETGRSCEWKKLISVVLIAYGGSLLLNGLVVVAFLKGLPALMGTAGHDHHNLMVVTMGMTAVIGGLVHFYAEKMAWSNEAAQYERMKTIFGDAARSLERLGVGQESSPTPGSARHDEVSQVIFELGKEALAENADWTLLHRERPIEIPPPGH